MKRSQKSDEPGRYRIRFVGRKVERARAAFSGRCALCGTEGRLKTEHRLIDGRRDVRWICTTARRTDAGDYEGCGRTALPRQALEEAVQATEAADPSLVRRSTKAEFDRELAARYAPAGRGRPRRFQPITRYAVARREAVEGLAKQLGRAPRSEEIRAALDLANGTFYRYEALLRAARARQACARVG